jgi:Holliday junction resolvase
MSEAHVRAGKRNAARGASWERWVRAWLERDGWMTFRSAGSHGVADVIGIQSAQGLSRVVLVSCRSTRRNATVPITSLWTHEERTVLTQAAEAVGAGAYLAAKTGRTARVYYDLPNPIPIEMELG